MKNESAPLRDVTGTVALPGTRIETVSVAKASYDPGYSLETTLGGKPVEDLKRGYCTEGY